MKIKSFALLTAASVLAASLMYVLPAQADNSMPSTTSPDNGMQNDNSSQSQDMNNMNNNSDNNSYNNNSSNSNSDENTPDAATGDDDY